MSPAEQRAVKPAMANRGRRRFGPYYALSDAGMCLTIDADATSSLAVEIDAHSPSRADRMRKPGLSDDANRQSLTSSLSVPLLAISYCGISDASSDCRTEAERPVTTLRNASVDPPRKRRHNAQHDRADALPFHRIRQMRTGESTDCRAYRYTSTPAFVRHRGRVPETVMVAMRPRNDPRRWQTSRRRCGERRCAEWLHEPHLIFLVD